MAAFTLGIPVEASLGNIAGVSLINATISTSLPLIINEGLTPKFDARAIMINTIFGTIGGRYGQILESAGGSTFGDLFSYPVLGVGAAIDESTKPKEK